MNLIEEERKKPEVEIEAKEVTTNMNKKIINKNNTKKRSKEITRTVGITGITEKTGIIETTGTTRITDKIEITETIKITRTNHNKSITMKRKEIMTAMKIEIPEIEAAANPEDTTTKTIDKNLHKK